MTYEVIAAALWAAVPAPTGRTGRRSAFQAVPAILLRGQYAVSWGLASLSGGVYTTPEEAW